MQKFKLRSSECWVQVERARKEDLDEIVAIENRAYPFPWTRQVLLDEIEGESFSYAYIARLLQASGQPEKIIGYHFFWLVADEIHILNIAVDPEYQGSGLGTFLLQFASDFGRERGATCILLEVRISNRPAQRLYQKMGFKRVAIRKQYYSDNKEDAYVMKLLL